MQRIYQLIALCLLTPLSYSQEVAIQHFVSDTFMIHASVSLCVKDADSGETIVAYNPGRSLAPASVMKLITSGVALEMLGSGHNFRTILGYTGSLNKNTGKLCGNIIIKGGGDPTLGSRYFPEHYQDFLNNWVSAIKAKGIKKISGSVITDDSYYDFLPVPSKWQWEDIGNYYGAGVFGLSVFDNTVEVHLKSADDSSKVRLTGINPSEYRYDFVNRLFAYGNSDEGYVFAAPYSENGWITGTIPVNNDDFILRASIADPPLFTARLLEQKLAASGIKITDEASTGRLKGTIKTDELKPISEISSPLLSDIIEVLNHESVNLYAETLLKELGKRFGKEGSTTSGSDVVRTFLENAGIPTDGLFIEDGSGLSPKDAIDSEALVNFLIYMKNHGKYFPEYFKSLPEAGKDGTLRSYFRDPVFEGRMCAKSGSMTRVRCYAGYITTNSGKNLAFSILVNNFTGTSQEVISGIENIVREIILYK